MNEKPPVVPQGAKECGATCISSAGTYVCNLVLGHTGTHHQVKQWSDIQWAHDARISPESAPAESFICPVCDYNMAPYPPKGYNICPQCGTEFENDDQTATHAELRQKWIDGGRKFFFKRESAPLLEEGGQVEAAGVKEQVSQVWPYAYAEYPDAMPPRWTPGWRVWSGLEGKRGGQLLGFAETSELEAWENALVLISRKDNPHRYESIAQGEMCSLCEKPWFHSNHPKPKVEAGGESQLEPASEEELLDKLAFAMMTVELNRGSHKSLDDGLRVPSEVRRTYTRLLASGEAQAMLAELRKSGLLAPSPQRWIAPVRGKILDVMHTLICIQDGRAVNAKVSAKACWQVLEEVERMIPAPPEGSN